MNNPILSVTNLSYSYSNKRQALLEVSLDINEGDIFFLIGANGAGKSTLLKNILGLLQPDTGNVMIDNLEMNYANRLSLMSKVGVLIENAAFYGHLTVQQNAYLIAEYYNVSKANADEAIKIVGLEQERDKKAARLSTGLKQRLGLATAILHQPKLVILDEPTNGLDPQGIIEFRDLVLQLNQERGITFFMTTHILNEVERLATRVGIIRAGHLLETFPIKDLYNNYQTIKLNELSGADIHTLSLNKDISYFKSGNTVQVILPKTMSLKALGLATNNLHAFPVTPIDLETYYLGKCYEFDTRSKNRVAEMAE